MASTITRDTWTNDTGTAAAPNLDGTIINNTALQNNIYARIDELFAGASPYNPIIFGGAVQADGQPRCFVFNSATQSINDSTYTALTFDSESFDVGSMHSTVSATSRVTIPTGQGGLYLILGQAGFAANATGYRELAISVNGTKFWSTTAAGSSAPTNNQVLNVVALHSGSATNYYELMAYQTSGGALNVGSAAAQYAAQLSVVRLW